MEDKELLITSKIVRLSNAGTAKRNKALLKFGLTATQVDALRIIFLNPDISITELMKPLALSQSVVSGIISRLEKNGYIKKTASGTDGRKVTLHVTDEGMRRKSDIRETEKEVQRLALAGMSNDEIDELCRLLDKIMNNIKSEKMNVGDEQ